MAFVVLSSSKSDDTFTYQITDSKVGTVVNENQSTFLATVGGFFLKQLVFFTRRFQTAKWKTASK